jgi:hypothetical protein
LVTTDSPSSKSSRSVADGDRDRELSPLSLTSGRRA